MFTLRLGRLIGFVILGASLLLMAACGAGNHTSSSQNAGTSADPSAQASEANSPLRVVVTYFPYADHLFAIGQADSVVGVVNLKSLQDFSVYDPFLRSGKISDIGDQVDYEKIAALKPDLIIASEHEDVEQLSKIAKTVTVKATLNWQETIKGVAAAVNEEAKADEYIQQFLSKQSEVAATLEKSGEKGKTALFIMPWKKSFTYWSGPRMSLYYDKLGFKPFDGLQNNGEINLEGIAALDPEYLFIGKDYTNSSDIKLDDLAADPIWNSLSAVKNKKMYIVDTEILGPLAMGQTKGLDYMATLFAK